MYQMDQMHRSINHVTFRMISGAPESAALIVECAVVETRSPDLTTPKHREDRSAIYYHLCDNARLRILLLQLPLLPDQDHEKCSAAVVSVHAGSWRSPPAPFLDACRLVQVANPRTL